MSARTGYGWWSYLGSYDTTSCAVLFECVLIWRPSLRTRTVYDTVCSPIAESSWAAYAYIPPPLWTACLYGRNSRPFAAGSTGSRSSAPVPRASRSNPPSSLRGPNDLSYSNVIVPSRSSLCANAASCSTAMGSQT